MLGTSERVQKVLLIKYRSGEFQEIAWKSEHFVFRLKFTSMWRSSPLTSGCVTSTLVFREIFGGLEEKFQALFYSWMVVEREDPSAQYIFTGTAEDVTDDDAFA